MHVSLNNYRCIIEVIPFIVYIYLNICFDIVYIYIYTISKRGELLQAATGWILDSQCTEAGQYCVLREG